MKTFIKSLAAFCALTSLVAISASNPNCTKYLETTPCGSLTSGDGGSCPDCLSVTSWKVVTGPTQNKRCKDRIDALADFDTVNNAGGTAPRTWQEYVWARFPGYTYCSTGVNGINNCGDATYTGSNGSDGSCAAEDCSGSCD